MYPNYYTLSVDHMDECIWVEMEFNLDSCRGLRVCIFNTFLYGYDCCIYNRNHRVI